MKTILTAAAVAALIASFAPVAISPVLADGITLKRGSSTSTRINRNRTSEEPGETSNEEPADNGDTGNDNGGDDVADTGDDNDSGWIWGGDRNDDNGPSVRNDDSRETVVLSRGSSRHQRRWKRRHHEPKRTIWIFNW